MRYYLFILVPCIFLQAFSKDQPAAVISLPENTFDFGRLMEDGGSASHRFTILNMGSAELSILNVRTTCGCAIPSWTRDPIPVGGEGFVEVAFNPEGRFGDFHKTIQIQSDAENSNMFVSVSGTVVPALKEEVLHHRIGGISIKADQVNLGYLYKGATGTEYITFRNDMETAVKLEFSNVPEHIILDAYPALLKPGEYGQIEVTYCTDKIHDWDVVIDQVSILLNGKAVREEKLSIVANIREDFRGLTPEQRLAAPVAVYHHDNVEFDTISSETPVICRFEIRNEGQTELKIRKVKVSCGCTVVTPEKNTLAPGESTQIEAIFDPAGRSGNFRNGITVVTNDPAHFKKYLFVEGYIRNR